MVAVAAVYVFFFFSSSGYCLYRSKFCVVSVCYTLWDIFSASKKNDSVLDMDNYFFACICGLCVACRLQLHITVEIL